MSANRKYKPLNRQTFSFGEYSIVPIRDEDKYDIMRWRNEQIYHLRQKEPLTREQQEAYFRNVVDKLFEREKPDQLLFSFLKNGKLIGYGGLVHIDWENHTAEVSFIMDTALEETEFEQNWQRFIHLLKKPAFDELGFHSVYVYAFDLRPHLYPALEKAGFQFTRRLKNEVQIEGKPVDVVIYHLYNDKPMKILFLGYPQSPLIDFLRSEGHEVTVMQDKINARFIEENQFDFIISYGYRHIIKEEVLNLLPGRVINLHISYLPYNRGADPNFWSFVDNTPKGVTIHLVDKGLDTGDILVQEKLSLSMDETLRSSYQKLQEAIQALFIKNWPDIRSGKIKPKPQKGKATYHRKKDKETLLQGLEDEYLDMKISDLLQRIKNRKS
ncbi:MAG: GNAT family N-acetyltransferase [Chlorobi bacterium]|nr:GNAT family N-acetyltransferase [Chlorobiota bacterium]